MRWSSDWDCTLERRDDGRPALRLGLRMVKHLSSEGARRLLAARAVRPFDDIADLAERRQLDRRDLEALAAGDALAGMAGHRHRAVWQVSGVERALPLLPAETAVPEGIPLLRAPREGQDIVADYGSLGLSCAAIPWRCCARGSRRAASLPTQALWELPNGRMGDDRGPGHHAPAAGQRERRDLRHHGRRDGPCEFDRLEAASPRRSARRCSNHACSRCRASCSEKAMCCT